MVSLVSQAIFASRVHDIAEEYPQHAQHAQTTGAPTLAKRMSAFATCMSKGLEQYWNVPANDPKIRAEIDLFPKRMI
jgi:hypothetical protein